MMYMGDIYRSNDHISAKYKGIGIEAADVNIQEQHTDSDGNKYLKVMSLFNIMTNFNNEGEIDDSAFGDVIEVIREHVNYPYGYSASGSTVDVSIATKEEAMKLFGVSNVNDSITLTGDIKAAFAMMAESAITDTFYLYTNTKDTSVAGNYFAVEIKKSANEITSAKFVSHALDNVNAYVIPVIEMNSAYVCSGETEEEYACYECPSENNKTILSWFKKGSQSANCKEVDKPKSKCATSPKTGVDSYLIPSAIVLGVCAIVLTVLKRKDAFKAI